MAGTLWDKGGGRRGAAEAALAERVQAFTVGNDPEIDAEILVDDCMGSIAHAAALRRAGVLSAEELSRLQGALWALARRHEVAGVPISRGQEDCHTAIEQQLTAELGDLGKKIHTGRSRNDQVLTAVRLYCRRRLLGVLGALLPLAGALLDRAEGAAELPLRGYSHTQPAMPTTFGAFLAAHAEALLDDSRLLRWAHAFNDRSPLGSAAGFGSVVPLDRDYEAELLGFGGGAQVSALYCQSSRGKVEGQVLCALGATADSLARLAGDLILFCSREFGYLRLPEVFTTGSSIMPQKQNPDVLELVRARAAVVAGAEAQCRALGAKLFSGYNRDYQLLKEPLVRAFDAVEQSLAIMEPLVRALEPDAGAMAASCTREIYAADVALEKAVAGLPFRDAYRQALDELAEVTVDQAFVRGRISAYATLGSMGNPGFSRLRGALGELAEELDALELRQSRALAALAATL